VKDYIAISRPLAKRPEKYLEPGTRNQEPGTLNLEPGT
jgi:hypothetical protein